MHRDIYFENVSFSYGTKAIFKQLDLHFPFGKNIALVGENGAGKSTLVKLLVGVYMPQEGRILIDGQDLSKMSGEERRQIFAAAFQDFYRYPLTLRENLTMYIGARAAEKELQRVLAAMGMEQYMGRLDFKMGKYGEDSMEFSDGQWQKVVIARALLAKAEMLVLDEPTASMDPISESNLYENFMKIMKLNSTLIVTHRMALAKYADIVVALQNGEVTGMGTHEELLAENAYYRKLYNEQSAWYK